MFGRTSTQVLDYSLTTIFYRKTTNKNDRKVAEGSGYPGGIGGGKWDKNKPR